MRLLEMTGLPARQRGLALLILVGIVLTWVRARTGTVAASYFVHLGYNGLQLLGYLAYTMGGTRH